MTQRVANSRAISSFALKRCERYSVFARLRHESRNLYYVSGVQFHSMNTLAANYEDASIGAMNGFLGLGENDGIGALNETYQNAVAAAYQTSVISSWNAITNAVTAWATAPGTDTDWSAYVRELLAHSQTEATMPSGSIFWSYTGRPGQDLKKCEKIPLGSCNEFMGWYNKKKETEEGGRLLEPKEKAIKVPNFLRYKRYFVQ